MAIKQKIKIPVLLFTLALFIRVSFYLVGSVYLPHNFQKFVTADTRFYYDPLALKMAASGHAEVSLLSVTRFTFLGYLSLFYRYLGYHHWPVSVFHCFLAAISVVFIYLSSRLFLSDKAAFIIGMLSVFNPVLVYWAPFVTSEAFFFFILSLSLYIFSLYLKTGKAIYALLVPLCSLLIFLSRPIGILLSLSMLLYLEWLLMQRAFRRNAAAWFILLNTLAAIFLSVIFLRFTANIDTVLKQPYPQELLQLSLYIDRIPNRGADSRHLRVHSARLTLLPGVVFQKTAEMPNPITARTILNYLKEYPGKYIGLTACRIYTLFNPWVREYSSRHNVFNLLFYGLLYFFSIIGFAQLRRSAPRLCSLVLIAILSLAAAIALTLVDYDFRLRLPIEFILNVPVGVAIARLLKIKEEGLLKV